MPVNQSNKGKNKPSRILETETYSEVRKVSNIEVESQTNKQSYLDIGDRQVLTDKKSSDREDSILTRLKVKTATLIGSAVVLPILAVGAVTYYFGSQTLDKQIVMARRANNLAIVQTELARQQNLLTALLIGTGTTALVAGAIAALGTKKLIDGESDFTPDQTQIDKSVLDLNRQQDIFQAIVEEVRKDLNCDRVVVYSLERHKYGEIVAESVVAGYTQAIGRKIDDPLERGYLDWYGNSKSRAIDDIEASYLSAGDREQLKQLEVKANLVTPILNRGNLLGILVAHQCNAPRKWQQSEINLLHLAAEKAGFTIENAQLCDRLIRLQSLTEKESKCTHHFDDAVRHISQSLQQEDILDISVEFVHGVLKCDRVVVYSLEGDKYGVVIAESVSAGRSRALNTTIENLNLYHDGRVCAIDNIYKAQLSQRYIEQLETLEVKASLVTPILNEGKLFGLLVAHQCSQARNWQDYEIRWMNSIATQMSSALNNTRIIAESAAVRERAETERKWTYYFDDAVRHMRQSLQQDDILNVSVEFVHRVLKCDRVVVYSLEGDKYGVVIAESVSAGYSKALNKTKEDPNDAKDLDLYGDSIRAIDNIYEAQLSQRYIEQLETLEVKASLVTPISNQGKLFVLVAHQCSQARNWQDYEIRWMNSIATQMSFALDNAILLKKLQHDERLTQLLNDFSLRISQTANKSKLLNTAVEQVRKIVKLDRAVVYQFDLKDRATVVAESVGSGYPQASLVNDLYSTEEYREDSPRVEAIADIHRSSLSDYRLKQLESLAVKASITVPILQDKQLFGLLIGHQCQQPRSWSQQETNLFTQLALQIGLVLDRVKLEEELISRNSQSNEDYTESNNLVQTDSSTIVKTTNIEQLDRLQPDLYQMLGTLHDLKSDRPTQVKLTQLPIEDITIEAGEITLDSVNNPESAFITGEFVEKLPATSKVIIVNQFEGDISELSDRISQQSLFVTESFQKLATFAKQLSEEDKK